MPDITMCQGNSESETCLQCYRKVATPNPYYQAYFISPPLKDISSKCDYFIPKRPAREVFIDNTSG